MTSMVEPQLLMEKLIDNLQNVIIGKRQTLELVVIGLLCKGHILIEDVPGVGKTMLARSLAKAINCTFHRIQFTPDMLPSDITGVSIFDQVNRQFEFRPGPIMAQIVLVDEVNRATPKTQSALLEAMEERQITVDGITHMLPTPFLVMATQNTIEYEGTFPLPEAQLDRFLIKVGLGYPSLNDEMKIIDLQKIEHPIEKLKPIASVEDILNAQKAIREIFVARSVIKYIVELTRSTRGCSDVYLGSSPRGSLGLYRASQARAALLGRDYVLPDDVKYLAEFILAHRILVDPAARLKDISPDLIIKEILRVLPIPGGDFNKVSIK